MDSELISDFSIKYKISKDRIAAEIWELNILKELMETQLSEYLVFKGETALRLAYNSLHFSDDLDFAICKDFNKDSFEFHQYTGIM